MADTDIPDVDDTDLTREEMEELAGEYDIDPDGLDDQELLERLGVALGEIDEAQIRERNERREEDRRSSAASLRGRFAARLEGAADRLRPADEERDRPAEEEAERSGDEGQKEAAEEEPARSDDEAGPGADTDGRGGSEETRDAEKTDGDEDPSEQRLPGEPIEGRTRNQLRDELRELGLPVTGTKAQLEQRLAEARSQQDSDAGDAGDDGGASDDAGERDGHDHGSRMDRLRGKVSRRLHHGSDRAEEDDAEAAGRADDGDEADDAEGAGGADDADEADDERLRDRLAEGLVTVADRLRASGQDDSASEAPSRLKRVGAAVKRRLPLG